MNLALLGINQSALPLVRHLAADRQHKVVAIHDVSQFEDELQALFPLALWDRQWESLLSGAVDGVVVCGKFEDDRRADQLRKLVQESVPLLVVHPACECMVAFELEMIRQDTGGVMVPYFPGGQHPLLAFVARMVAEGAGDEAKTNRLGELEQLVFERSLADRSRDSVLSELARDLEVIRRLLGGISNVSAMQGTREAESYANLSMHLLTDDNILARWSVVPASGDSIGKVKLIGSDGTSTLTLGADPRQWRVESEAPGHDPTSREDWDDCQTICKTFAAAIEGSEPAWTWNEACQNLEVVSAVQQSLKRGRTIELYGEEHTEEQSFKGVMAMGGCLLLLMGMLIMLGMALFEGLTWPFRDRPGELEFDNPTPRSHLLLRLWPFYPFIAFLLLQLLRLVFRTDSKPASTHTAESAN